MLSSILTPIIEPKITGHLVDDKKFLANFQLWLEERFELGDNIIELIATRAMFIDTLLTQVWQVYKLDQEAEIALIAVGGYGRGELHPCSDIDLLICSQRPLSNHQQDVISRFVTYLWDLKLDIGHSVRTLDECYQIGRDDITVATNLIESRLIAGKSSLCDELRQHIEGDNFWTGEAFFQAKLDEQEARHRHYKGAAYRLEPDLKSNPGGLRDIQTINWVALRHFGDASLHTMTRENFLTHPEYRELIDCQNFLWKLRFALHLQVKRGDDRLLFDRQMHIAQSLGYEGEGNEAVEQMMKRFYQTIRRVNELNEMLLQRFDEVILGNRERVKIPLDEHFQIRGNLIDLIDREIFSDRPDLIMAMFLHIANHPEITGIYSSTLRRLRATRRRMTVWLQDIPACRQLFMSILRHPDGMGTAFSLMHKYGVISAYLPQWSLIVGQMQFDLFHAFTVDEHTHRVVRNVRRFQTGEDCEAHPLCCELVEQMDKPELLYLSAIFHDIGKGRPGNHSEVGARDVDQFAQLHQLSKTDTRMVARLVENHLIMSVTAQRRDIHDPDVINEFAARVGNENTLNYLYCLTVADICATNSSLWNSWKGSLLMQLHQLTQRALLAGLENPIDRKQRVREHKDAAARILRERRVAQKFLAQLWPRFNSEYFLRHNGSQIAWHSELLEQHSVGPLVAVAAERGRGGNEIFVYHTDHIGLFSQLVTTLEQCNLSIHDAQLINTRDGFVTDTFMVLERDGQELNPERRQQVHTRLVNALNGNRRPLRHRRLSRQMQHFKFNPRITFLGETKQRTLLELVAFDKPGLLVQVANIFKLLDISVHAARIGTIGERAEDFFLLTDRQLQPLNAEQKEQLHERLYEALSDET